MRRTVKWSGRTKRGVGASVERIRQVAQEYFEAAAIRLRVHHDFRGWAAGQWFTLEMEGWPALQANLEVETWHVTVWNPRANPVYQKYESDEDLLSARDKLVELLAAGNMEAAANGSEEPAADRERPMSLFNFNTLPWNRGISLPGTAMRPVKVTLYIIAFGIGFALTTLLLKDVDQPPAAHGTHRPGVSRHAVTSLSSRAPRPPSNYRTSAALVFPPPAFHAAALPSIPVHRGSVPRTSGLVVRAGQKTAVSQGAPSFFVVPAPDVPPDVPASEGGTRQPAVQSLRFRVQVGVFDTRDTAEALLHRLNSLGYASALDVDDVYRVRVGGYFDRDTAERLATNLRTAGFDAVLEP